MAIQQEHVELDRKRPFGIVYGEPRFAFEQDGVHFSADGSTTERWSTREKIANERAQAENRRMKEQELARQMQMRERMRKLAEE